MRTSRWLHGLTSPSGVVHVRDLRSKSKRALCGAAAIETRDGRQLWRWHTTYRTPTCRRCRGIARRRYGV